MANARNWDTDRITAVVRGLGRRKILVVGDVGVDRYVTGRVERISPEAPVPIVNVDREYLKLGLAANVADNIRALQSQAELVGIVGADRGAQDLGGLLRGAKLSTQGLVVDRARRTTLKERVLGENQQLLRIDYETEVSGQSAMEKQVLAKVAKLLPRCEVVIIQDYAKGIFTASLLAAIYALARKQRKWVAVDPNGKTPIEWYRFGERTLFKPNLKEAESLSGIKIHDDKTLAAAGAKLLSRTGAETVIITRGKDGMAIFGRGSKKPGWVPTFSREVYDVSGAGDTVIAVLALGLAAGASIEESALVANLAAGVEVSKRGTATVSQTEILESMRYFLAAK